MILLEIYKFCALLLHWILLPLLGSTIHEEKAENILVSPPIEIAFVQLSFDGVNTLHCGVGTVVLETLIAFNKINEKQIFNIKPYLLSADYHNTLDEYSLSTLKNNISACTKMGGEVYLIPTTKGDQIFGDPSQWEELCSEGAKICTDIINTNPYTIIVAHDTAYAHIPMLLRDLFLKGEIKNQYQALWVPHATSWNYNGYNEELKPNWPGRHYWELESFQMAEKCKYKIGCIGNSIQEYVCMPPFNIKNEDLFHYGTGISLEKYLPAISEEKIAKELKKRGIPLDKRIIFSIGRAAPLKGQDIVLEMYRHLKEIYSDIHLVLLAPKAAHTPEFCELLKSRNAIEQIGATVIDIFDTELAHYIYQWPKTSLIALLSRADTQPLTVMEARANPKNAVVLVSNQGGMGAQVHDGIDGFVGEIDEFKETISHPLPLTGDLEKLVRQACSILEMSADEKAAIVAEGKRLIKENYDIKKNVIRNLNRLLDCTSTNQLQRIAPCDELQSHEAFIKKMYNFTESLFFETLTGGIVNPPICVFKEKNGEKIPLGVFKAEPGNELNTISRLKAVDEMMQCGFVHSPSILRNIHGHLITKIGNTNYSLIEYLPADLYREGLKNREVPRRRPEFESGEAVAEAAKLKKFSDADGSQSLWLSDAGRTDSSITSGISNQLSFEEMLKLTGQFHAYSQYLSLPLSLHKSKLNEYLKRSAIFSDEILKQWNPQFFQSSQWETIKVLNSYFSSEDFKKIYDDLPKGLIIGDNNPSNIIIARQTPYFIDLDARRVDVRLLDLTSFIRFGYFENYLELRKKNDFFSTIDLTYGREFKHLENLEKEHFHSVVQFSHIEFMTWALTRLKKAIMEQAPNEIEQFFGYVSLYAEQIKKLE